MKTKLIILSLVFLVSGYNANAQLLKKLKEAVKQGVDAVDGNEKENDRQDKEGKAEGKAPAGNQSAAMPMGMGMEEIPAPSDNNVQLPDSYQFSYRATLRIENSKGTAEPVFYLQPDAQYYARKQANNQGLTEFLVLDNQNNLAVMFAEFEGDKRRIHNKINLLTKATLIGAYRDWPEKEVKAIESKSIMGYNCQGYQITSEGGITQLWITDEAPASLFTSMLEHKADNPGSPFNKDSMIMEVNFTSAKTPEQNYQMVCTEIQPETLILNKNDYQEAL